MSFPDSGGYIASREFSALLFNGSYHGFFECRQVSHRSEFFWRVVLLVLLPRYHAEV